MTNIHSRCITNTVKRYTSLFFWCHLKKTKKKSSTLAGLYVWIINEVFPPILAIHNYRKSFCRTKCWFFSAHGKCVVVVKYLLNLSHTKNLFSVSFQRCSRQCDCSKRSIATFENFSSNFLFEYDRQRSI
jgi:hypothetical protein